jgi:hypothetical protein
VDTVARRLALGRSKAYALVRRAGILRDLDGALRVEEIELINGIATKKSRAVGFASFALNCGFRGDLNTDSGRSEQTVPEGLNRVRADR